MKTVVAGFRVLVLAAGLSVLCYGDAINQAEVFVNPNDSGGTGPFSKVLSQIGAIDIGGSAHAPSAGGGPDETGDGSAHVEYGKLKLFTSFFANGNASAFGRFRDDVLIQDPSHPVGTVMTVDYKIWIDGLLLVDAAGSNDARWLVQSALGSNLFNITQHGDKYSPYLAQQKGVPDYVGDPLGQYYLAETTVQNFVAAQLDVELNLVSFGGHDNSGQPGSATTNFLNSVEWGGIQSVTVNGQPVSYTVSSTSGTDYSKSFVTASPEPASGILMTGAFGAIWLLRRKRARN